MLPTSKALIECIERAFATVERSDGITLHQAIALDHYAAEEEALAARLQDTETHWSEISRATLGNFESALSFLDIQGTRYYLPVFMLAAIEGYISPLIPFFKVTRMMGSLRKSTPEKVISNCSFNQDQCLAIAAFLRFVIGEQGEKAESQAEIQLVQEWEAYVTHWDA